MMMIVYLLFRYLLNQLDWLEDALGGYEEDYLIVDCPGQIELYTHYPIMQRIIQVFHREGYRVCGVYILDSQFIEDSSKFFAGVMSAMSAMIQLEIPHINVLSKMDLVPEELKQTMQLDRYCEAAANLVDILILIIRYYWKTSIHKQAANFTF